MISNKIWQMREKESDTIKKISKENNLPEVLSAILAGRGLVTKKDINLFLNPTRDKLHDPFLMKDMKLAVERIIAAKIHQEQITVYGDYDVDGITSTSVVYMFLKEIDCLVDYYIPDRVNEGYGINKNALKILKEQGTDLIISVDTGITAVDECIFAKELGMDMIITDHHEYQDQLPEAVAILNPKRKDSAYPFELLAGVGVAFKLVHGISLQLKIENQIWKYLELVAVGTVSDLVPLINENRIFVKLAFETMFKSWNIGLKALIKVSGIKTDKMTAGMIGFQIGPRLNAAGRLGDAKRGVELFITQDHLRAATIAEELNLENIKRQKIEQQILEDAIHHIEDNPELLNQKVLVIASSGWTHGVIGIVASRIVEKYYKPTILLTIENNIASGSARSVEGFNIFEALTDSKDLFIKFGGHEMAAGMSLEEDNIPLLSTRLNYYADQTMDESTLIQKIKVDYKLHGKEVDLEFIEEINEFEPYGMGNPQPNFILAGYPNRLKLIGKDNNHLKMELVGQENNIQVLGFKYGHIVDLIGIHTPIEVVATLNINEWQEKRTPQLLLKDIKLNEKYEKNLLDDMNVISNLNDLNTKEYHHRLPIKEDYKILYRYLLNLHKQKETKISSVKLLSDLHNGGVDNTLKILICFEVFKELGLMNYCLSDGIIAFEIYKSNKVELSMSKLYNKWTDQK